MQKVLIDRCNADTLLKELHVLVPLPIAILATLSPIAVSDVVPKFDIAKECHFEGGSTVAFDRCSQDETAALQQLQAEWSQFAGADRSTCLVEATVAGFASYVELLICLEMARDVSNRTKPSSPFAKTELQSTDQSDPKMSVGDQHDPIALRSDR